MKKENITEEEVIKALRKFVDAGVLMMGMKDGEVAYQNNPEFDKKSKAEQKLVLNKIK